MQTRNPKVAKPAASFTAAEFFAGIGLARIGLQRAGVDTVWSNDISPQKAALYGRHFSATPLHRFILGDLGQLPREDLPRGIDIAWASFPCTDLSVAGGRAGLHRGSASSTFWHFIKALSRLGDDRPRVVALENVTAFATSHAGKDIESAIRSLNGLGYSIDILSLDAKRFVPQSRPRLFLIGVLDLPELTNDVQSYRPKWLEPIFANKTLMTHRAVLPAPPEKSTERLADVIDAASDLEPLWWSEEKVEAFKGTLSPLQSKRVSVLRDSGELHYRTAYKRMRNGAPRWELRSDEISGCLRTARGGSSKQAIARIEAGRFDVRWMTPREYAYLMGVNDFHLETVIEKHALDGFGDAVCVPVVEWLAKHYIVPHLERSNVRVLEDGSAPNDTRLRAVREDQGRIVA